MEEEIELINSNTRIEKIKGFFINYKKLLFSFLVIIILGLFVFFFYEDYKSNKKEELARKYNLAIIKYDSVSFTHQPKSKFSNGPKSSGFKSLK